MDASDSRTRFAHWLGDETGRYVSEEKDEVSEIPHTSAAGKSLYNKSMQRTNLRVVKVV